MATIIAFVLSLLVASTLILIKAIELRSERKNFILRLVGKLDTKSEKFVSALKFRSLQLIQSIKYIFLVQFRTVCRHLFSWAHEKIMQEYKSRQNFIMMGRKDVPGKGSVSFYLKKITEHKDGSEKGKIED
jgi:hypothetical protein